MKIEDNFLARRVFNELQAFMVGPEGAPAGAALPWYYNSLIDYDDEISDKFQFTHLFYAGDVPQSVNIKIIDPVLIKIEPISVWRIKANLLTRTPNIIENTFHTDIGNLIDKPEKLAQWTTSIFYINTNNGYTEFEDGTKVESVANRMVTFPTNLKHRGTSCTDEKTRVVINFNYFKR